jgi:hypothetical protein
VKALFLTIFLSLPVFSQTVGQLQLGFGSITPHFSETKKNYCNQWNNTGLIVNKNLLFKGWTWAICINLP